MYLRWHHTARLFICMCGSIHSVQCHWLVRKGGTDAEPLHTVFTLTDPDGKSTRVAGGKPVARSFLFTVAFDEAGMNRFNKAKKEAEHVFNFFPVSCVERVYSTGVPSSGRVSAGT